ncbi:MAG: hypothetical protein HY861_01920 [Chlamydiia bacterium]|nr:hypothetical protein [Chlamydiia bacterium]
MELWVYYLVRTLAFPLQWMPYSWIRKIGLVIGNLMFRCLGSYRKSVLSNLALAKDLPRSQKELLRIAKESFQNLAIVCLEYPRLGKEKALSPTIFCENPETAETIYKTGKGIIFFCGHLANWETLFLEGTNRMQGIAIAKPIANKRLYLWILSIREKYGGKIIAQRNAMAEGFRALKKGKFLGIVGDQGMPSSGYSSLFLGRRAWTSTAPALLAYRTGSPILFASVRRTPTGYTIRYSEPIYPDLSQPLDSAVIHMMDASLAYLQESIKERPGEWLWQHNRWKQQTPQNVYRRFRHDSLCLILPPDPRECLPLLPHLSILRTIYPNDFLLLYAPRFCHSLPLIQADETLFYESIEETLQNDYRCKLVFNFTSLKTIHRHYLSLSAFEVLDLPTLKTLAAPHLPPPLQDDLSEILKRALCRPGSLWQKESV